MAAITFNSAHRTAHIRGRLEPMLALLRESLDAFLSRRTRLAAAQAEYVRSQQVQPTSPLGKPAMIAVQLMSPDLSLHQVSRLSSPAILPTDALAAQTAPFAPLDSDIVNEAIPAFFIGRNNEGLWVARDVKGEFGGIFLFESSAVSFARKSSRPAGCATIFPSQKFELDLENKGNPLVAQFASLMHIARHLRKQMSGFTGKLAQAGKRR
jgi:hypothetical protein